MLIKLLVVKIFRDKKIPAGWTGIENHRMPDWFPPPFHESG
jgi:hypothetical protein